MVDLREILKETSARRDSASQVAGIDWSAGGDVLYMAEFGCHIRDTLQLVRLSRAARGVKTTADVMKFYGGLIEAKSKLINLNKGFGIWGWVSVNV